MSKQVAGRGHEGVRCASETVDQLVSIFLAPLEAHHGMKCKIHAADMNIDAV